MENDDLELVFRRACSGGEGTLRIAFTAYDQQEAFVTVSAHCPQELVGQGLLEVVFKTMCYGSDLIQFLHGLEELIKNYDGKAVFKNALMDTEIAFELTDKGLGTVEVSVSHGHISFVDDSTRAAKTSTISLAGFETDQSYLPKYAKDIKGFLELNKML